ERRARRGRGQPSLLSRHLFEGQAAPAELGGHHGGQIPGLAQVVQVLVRERVLGVVSGGTGTDTGQEVPGEEPLGRALDVGHAAWNQDRTRPIPTRRPPRAETRVKSGCSNVRSKLRFPLSAGRLSAGKG